jgi:cell division inhibitor SulA/protein ImuA
MLNSAIRNLLGHPGLWLGDGSGIATGRETVTTGHAPLDALLPGGGWPLGAVTEILPACDGIGEVRLLVPVLADLSRRGRHIAWVNPPHVPYPPAFAASGIEVSRLLLVCVGFNRDRLWAAEHCLRSGACGAVLLWPEECDNQSLRRLQLAAEKGGGLGFLFRSQHAAESPSPAALRLRLAPLPGGLTVEIVKGRGGAGRRAELRLAG